ncbi:hypothetical protein FIB18_22995 [Brucella pecoris]|uniref:Uncharacterized protein n=1 Tax=Brucella pecoris TaxID=867683 RepID=A0A5C5CBX6_9HYPH|nr:hypothetical protein FIB18_22995 [Brucella pecoris]
MFFETLCLKKHQCIEIAGY